MVIEGVWNGQLYEEMKELYALKKVCKLKQRIFEQRKFQLRGLVLENLRSLIRMQLKALDEHYQFIGLNAWDEEEHFLHDLGEKISQELDAEHKDFIERVLHNSGFPNEGMLVDLVRDFIRLLYHLLVEISVENMIKINEMMKQEEEKVNKIMKIITPEGKPELQKI
ncbi:hypothetical protein GOV09_04520 [Candidatus Woesearchaeota archaeon]|nr:hypothetical protein [Candidatus Woesearchaeota archaeon]